MNPCATDSVHRDAGTPSEEDFAAIVQSLSERDRYKHCCNNLVSNEGFYSSVIDQLPQGRARHAAYIGVGPEQNYTYITRLEPSICFIVDVRRSAMILHLIYKAVFALSEDRSHFLSLLLSRPLTSNAPRQHVSLQELMDYFSTARASADAQANNLRRIEEAIRNEYRLPMSSNDTEVLRSVHSAFCDAGLAISFDLRARGDMLSLRDLLEETGPSGKYCSYLASEKHYEFIRDLHRRNRVIPVVGDFAGSKTLRAVGKYLSSHSYAVDAFYTSNVEYFLFKEGTFKVFVENLKALPMTTESIFIRAGPTMIVQRVSECLRAYAEGRYARYSDLVSSFR